MQRSSAPTHKLRNRPGRSPPSGPTARPAGRYDEAASLPTLDSLSSYREATPLLGTTRDEEAPSGPDAPSVADMGIQVGDRPKPRLSRTVWTCLSALLIPFLLAVVLLLTVSLIARVWQLSPLMPSPQSVLLSPHVFPSWLSSSPTSYGAVQLVPSPFDPSQSVHPDVAYLLQQAHNDTALIPDIIHFVIGTSHTASSPSSPSSPPVTSPPTFLLQHWLALKSAAEVLQPSAIYCHVVTPPESLWWFKAASYCTRVLPTRTLTHIFGRPVHHRQHKADILRLEAVLQWGGVGMDLDTLTVASWKADPAQYELLFKQDVLLGLTQSAGKNWADRYDGSWVAARPGASLLREWYGTYRMFHEGSVAVRQGVVEGSGDTAWTDYDDHLLSFTHTLLWTLSVLRPHLLTSLQPQVMGLPYAWEEEGMKKLYGEGGGGVTADGQWTVHLWQDEHEARRVSVTKDGVVTDVEGAMTDEVRELYHVDDEQQVCALAAKSLYGRLLLQAMNANTVAYPCPPG